MATGKMHFAALTRLAVALAVLSGTTAAMGMGVSPIKQDLKLMAELGIAPGDLLIQRKSVYEVARERASENLTAQYTAVRLVLHI